MRRTTVVLPDPDPPATPITRVVIRIAYRTTAVLFVSQGDAGIESRRTAGGYEAGNESDYPENHDGEADRCRIVRPQPEEQASRRVSRQHGENRADDDARANEDRRLPHHHAQHVS